VLADDTYYERVGDFDRGLRRFQKISIVVGIRSASFTRTSSRDSPNSSPNTRLSDRNWTKEAPCHSIASRSFANSLSKDN
jgi:hypothetical protein